MLFFLLTKSWLNYSLSRTEESWKKKIVCLSVRRVKKTFPIENTEISIFVLNDGSVVVGGWSAPLPPLRSKEHTSGVKKTFLIFKFFFGFIFLHKGLLFSQKIIFL
jgi:hypothetical protein